MSFARKLSAALKNYRNNSAAIHAVLVESLEFARDNNHNPVYLQKILDAMDGRDISDVALIITKCGPFNIKEGHITPIKKKEKVYSLDHAKAWDGSFRTFAGTLREPTETVEKPFDIDAYAARIVKKMLAENITPEKLTAALSAALVKAQELPGQKKAQAKA